jgi:hypothetical protein
MLQLLVPFASLTAATVSQAAPSGAHPRLWLDAETRSSLAANAEVPGSAVARGAERCSAARNDPDAYSAGGWQGFEFVTTLSSCLISWAAKLAPEDLETAIKYWNVLLDDYKTVGDGAGGDDVVTHDTGYAMRTFAPYSAIAYDWLHDAPGVTESLRARTRERFAAWVEYYSSTGYLRDMPGANYQAGYLFAATLIAIAEAGEAGATGDEHWSLVTDSIWGRDMAGALASGGVLDGGDWPEGWQYGDLSVLEYSLAARALVDNGHTVPGAAEWTDALVMRFANGLTPTTRQFYVAGDTEDPTVNRDPGNGPLLAAMAGPAGNQARAWARRLNRDLALENENPLFDALAEARASEEAALPSDMPTNYLAPGVGNFYARGSWDEATIWSVFQCSRRLVDDHQHNNAGNWVMTLGGDDLVVDPSPYGTSSTLTGNAPAVDTNSLPDGYSPSQAFWGETTRMAWARQSSSGVAAARCDYADQFRGNDVASDVGSALRDFVLLPDAGAGAIVLVDRVVTGDAGRGLHLRVRTPGTLTLSGDRASAAVGTSTLEIERVHSSSGAPNVREMPRDAECPWSDHTCDISRIPAGTEYRLDVEGPSALALHVVTGRPSGGAAHVTEELSGTGYRGVLVRQSASSVAVIASDAAGAVQTFTYAAPAREDLVHVVVDAPVDANGNSDVTARREGADCIVSVTAHTGAGSGFAGRPLIVRTTDGCEVSDDGSQVPPTTPTTSPPDDDDGTVTGAGSAPAEGGGAATDDDASGGTRATGRGGASGSASAAPADNAAGTESGGSSAMHPAATNAEATGVAPVTPPLSSCSVGTPSRSGLGGESALLAALFGLLFTRRRRVFAVR